jgi:TP901 family phage tail tape measure protein
VSQYDLGRASGRIEFDASGAQAGARDAQGALDDVNRSTQNTREEAKMAATALLGIGIAALSGIGLAVGAAANFEQGMSNVRSVTGATDKEMDRLRDTALRIGRDTAFGAGEAAQAMFELSKAGIDVRDVVNGAADATVALAAAGEIAMPRAAAIMAAAMNIFGLSGDEATRAADVLAGTANNSATSVEQLGSALEQTGPTAALLGVSIEDTATMLGIMAERGIEGGKAGTTLNRMLLNLTNQTPKATEAMEELGLITEDGNNKFFDAEGNMKSMSEVAGLLSESMEGLTKEQQASYLETIFGTRALAAASAMAEAGAEGFDELSGAIAGVSAADVAEEKLNNLRGALTILKGTIETALIAAGTPLLGFLTDLVRSLTGVINKFSELPEGIQTAIVAAVGAFGAIATLVGGWVLMGSRVMAMGRSFLALGKLIGMAFISPVGLALVAAAALAAGIYFLYQNSETFRDIIARVGEFLTGTVVPAMRNLADVARNVLGKAIDWLKGIWEELEPRIDGIMDSLRTMGGQFREIAEAVKPIVMWIGEFLVQAFQTFWNIAGPILGFLASLLMDTVRMAINGVVQAFQGALQIITGILDLFIGLFTGDWSRMWEGIKSIAAGIFNAIVGAVQTFLAVSVFKIFGSALKAITALWRGAWNGIRSFFTGIINGIRNFLTNSMNGMRNTVTSIKQSISNVITNVWNAIRNFITNILNNIANFIKTIFNAYLNVIRTVLNSIRSVVTSIFNGIRSLITSVLNAIRAVITSVWNAIRTTITSVLNGIRNTVTSIFNGIQTTITGVVNTVRNLITQGFQRARDGAVNAITSLLRTVRELPGQILGALGNTGKMLFDAGKSIIRGLINGIKAMAGKVKEAIGGVMSSARDMLPFSPAKEGPFSGRGWTTYAGQSIIDALAEGMEDQERKAVRATEAVAGSLAAALQDSLMTPDLKVPLTDLLQGQSLGSVTYVTADRRVDRSSERSASKTVHFEQTVINPDNAELERASRRALRTAASEWEID